ncbi:aldo/keto reductase [Winogradskyella endarachnes]|uniref:Aldo/keto reductase n=1 Tax=Winogradskyella endarachnes TaxID=2681965 RepID=A0A6L6U9I9_9FLAO|nr:aldo/keto reductase [Winogradskyella endarachnes]MUU78933.1 aldo/keto reductase [Winogradskyella endarachnes]
MKYKKYIKDSIKISEIGLGAWQLGQNSGWKSMTKTEAIRLVHKSLDFGINFFDTAPNYGHGTGEERLGEALKVSDRNKIVINTKFGHTHTGTLNFSANYIRESLEGSLKRLQVDYVDSLIIHNPPSKYFDGNKNDHYEILDKLIEEGKIKAYGASLDTYDDMKLLMDTTNSKIIEVFFNILHQDTLRGFEQAQNEEVGIIVKIPLDSGWLTGKYNAESNFDDIRSRWSKEDVETRAKLVDKVKSIFGTEENLAQKAIAFCLAYDAVSTVIPGNVTINQLTSNLRSTDIHISRRTIEELEKLYQTEIKKRKLPW